MSKDFWVECVETLGPRIRGIREPERVVLPASEVTAGAAYSFRSNEGGKQHYWSGVVPEIRDGYATFILSDDKRSTPADG